MPLDQAPSYVITAKGQKHPRANHSANTAGNAMPRSVNLARKELNPELTCEEVPGTMYTLMVD